MLVFADPKEWWITLPSLPGGGPGESGRSSPWQSLPQSQPGRQWEAYLSELCLQHLVPWLQETYDEVRPWLAAADWPAIWGSIAGCAVQIGAQRLILIPSDAIEGDCLTVTQEWVDLLDWAGDYYLAVQFCTEVQSQALSSQVLPSQALPSQALPSQALTSQALRVWGYASHHTLKTEGDYDAVTRTYSLDARHLDQDMSTFGVIQQCCPDLQTRAPLEPLPTVAPVQSTNLLDRLSNPDLIFPRLSVPFVTWGALIQDANWRQRFYQQRQGQLQAQPEAPIVRLSQWLNGVVEAGWQSLEDLVGGSLTPQLRLVEPSPTEDRARLQRAKVVTLVDQNQQEISLAIVIAVNALASEPSPTLQLQVQLHPLQCSTLPPHLSLALYDPQSQACLQTVYSQSGSNYIQLGRFRASAGESFQIQIAIAEATAGMTDGATDVIPGASPVVETFWV